MKRFSIALLAALAVASTGATLHGSSHREAPRIAKSPKLDGTDFYMFRSYEAGRSNYVTLLANYIPLQDVYGGPNFFTLDQDGLYEIHIDNNGDGREDITYQFRFFNTYKNLTVPVGGKDIPIPLINIGGIGPGKNDTANSNLIENYTLSVVYGDRRFGLKLPVANLTDGGFVFTKPTDRIGDKSIANNDPTAYGAYADSHIANIRIPGCATPGRVFVGQRREGFVVNLAEAFDLINTNPLGAPDAESNVLADKNVTTLALEVPVNCLATSADPVIGGWTTASASDDRTTLDDKLPDFLRFQQVSRLSAPLVNELVIGLKDKDRFNASEPKDDAQFGDYVTNPSLPALIEALFGVPQPATPRNDLVQVFLTGVPGLNQPKHVKPAEMVRLNTSIMPVPAAMQKPLGVIGGDNAGFPNGRRPGDDVVDIALQAVEGILLPGHPAAIAQLTDGAFVSATVAYSPEGTIVANPSMRLFRDTFPYLQTPISGSPDPAHQ